MQESEIFDISAKCSYILQNYSLIRHIFTYVCQMMPHTAKCRQFTIPITTIHCKQFRILLTHFHSNQQHFNGFRSIYALKTQRLTEYRSNFQLMTVFRLISEYYALFDNIMYNFSGICNLFLNQCIMQQLFPVVVRHWQYFAALTARPYFVIFRCNLQYIGVSSRILQYFVIFCKIRLYFSMIAGLIWFCISQYFQSLTPLRLCSEYFAASVSISPYFLYFY